MNNQIINSKGLEIEIEAFHPGQMLLAEIEFRQIQKKNFAKQIGISPTTLNLIFKGKRDISSSLAIKIAQELSISSELLYNMQSNYNNKSVIEKAKEPINVF